MCRWRGMRPPHPPSVSATGKKRKEKKNRKGEEGRRGGEKGNGLKGCIGLWTGFKSQYLLTHWIFIISLLAFILTLWSLRQRAVGLCYGYTGYAVDGQTDACSAGSTWLSRCSDAAYTQTIRLRHLTSSSQQQQQQQQPITRVVDDGRRNYEL